MLRPLSVTGIWAMLGDDRRIGNATFIGIGIGAVHGVTKDRRVRV